MTRWRCILLPWHRPVMRWFGDRWHRHGIIVTCSCGNTYEALP